ncbi:uncharacterized protein JOC78_000859 [Bacillus ectoiniformans]|uniref:HD domain-containing protein n=1 Tax=Bacillus ectoiniformans TaxID=1494429 RepID=UPI00195C8527|nr:HD domain-containing protein [Bacillus ectoiniformans]MBM7647919.1 uncharacterized protein [Bacillus ectoiniformans]
MHDAIKIAEKYIKDLFESTEGSHDWQHIDRVRKLAIYIAEEEKAEDRIVIELAALLHELPDDKLCDILEHGDRQANQLLQTLPITAKQLDKIDEIIHTISFRGGNGQPVNSIEARIVQDADRLDAMGAIGIARAFAYGGKKRRPLYDSSLQAREEMTEEEYRNGQSSTIHHFYEKLLKLEGLMNTQTGKKLAREKHQFMEQFLQQFMREWNQ